MATQQEKEQLQAAIAYLEAELAQLPSETQYAPRRARIIELLDMLYAIAGQPDADALN